MSTFTTSADLAALTEGQPANATEIITDPNVRVSIDQAALAFSKSMSVDELPDDDGSPLEMPARDPETGQFITKSAPEPDATGDTAEPAEPVADETTEPAVEPAVAAESEVVTLLDRNGNPREIAIDDPEIKEILLANKNDGLRRSEFNRRIETVQQKEQEFRAFEIMLQSTPESLVDRMSSDIKMRTLNYLLANNFHEVKPILEQWYGDDTARREALLGMRETMTESQRTASAQVQEGNRRQNIGSAIESLIPETASPEDAQDFFTAAAAHVASVDAQRGYSLKAEEVAPLLDRFRARFGFTSPAATETVTAPSLVPVAKAAVAAPLGKAADVAKRATATAHRMKALPVQQAAAAKVAQGSAGSVAAQPPRPKSIEEAARNFMASLNG